MTDQSQGRHFLTRRKGSLRIEWRGGTGGERETPPGLRWSGPPHFCNASAVSDGRASLSFHARREIAYVER